MTALWIHEAAERFWIEAGGAPNELPRDIGSAVSWALPVAVISLSGLRIAAVDAWLAEHDVGARLSVPDRPLRACVLVHEGNGLLFVDHEDDEDERRFSVAHETAHYLLEYALPRERTRRRLGPEVLPVLDGRRAPSPEERIGAVLAGVALGVRLHLMERTPSGHPTDRDVSAAERCADELALELLAPIDAVRARLKGHRSRPEVEALLRGTFGLPPTPARAFARRLTPSPPDGSLFRRLFSAP